MFLAQIRSWAVHGALTGAGALVASALASGIGASLRLPWAPAVAAAGGTVALVAVALALAAARPPSSD